MLLEREISLDDQIAVKKRKVTNSSTISTVEDSFLRINEWAEHIIKRLEDGIVSLELVDKQLLLEETEAEVKTQQEKILVLIKEGETLINGKETLNKSRSRSSVDLVRFKDSPTFSQFFNITSLAHF